MDLIAWKRVLDGRTMSGYSNCIEYLIERQSTFAMWKFAACVSELLLMLGGFLFDAYIAITNFREVSRILRTSIKRE